MIIGAKYKICRRLGAGVFEKCQTAKFAANEAATIKPRKMGGRSGGSTFGVQLLEKQKARFSYGISERQFFRYVKEAMEQRGGSSAIELVSRLEARLDNVVYRLGLASSRRQARQLVSHGHIIVNDKRITVPSYKAQKGDEISVRKESRQSPFFAGLTERIAVRKLPNWLKASDDQFLASVEADPEIKATDLIFDPAVIIQFYSR